MDIAAGILGIAFSLWIAIRIKTGKTRREAWSEAHDFTGALLVLLMAGLCLVMLVALVWIAWVLVPLLLRP
jgi:hypothetical protein